jgi:hypothetical protein
LRTQSLFSHQLEVEGLCQLFHHEVIALAPFFILCDPLPPSLRRFFLAFNDGRFQLLLFLSLLFWR